MNCGLFCFIWFCHFNIIFVLLFSKKRDCFGSFVSNFFSMAANREVFFLYFLNNRNGTYKPSSKQRSKEICPKRDVSIDSIYGLWWLHRPYINRIYILYMCITKCVIHIHITLNDTGLSSTTSDADYSLPSCLWSTKDKN